MREREILRLGDTERRIAMETTTTGKEPSAKQDESTEKKYRWFEGVFDDGGKFRFRFRHEGKNGGSRVTMCFLEHDEDSGELMLYPSSGISCCCPIDNFDRDFGRKKALVDAIENGAYLTNTDCKDDRRAIWRCYFVTRGITMRHEKKGKSNANANNGHG